jgi:hypothetical protein
MNRIPEKLRNMGCKDKKKQCFTDYVSYLSTQDFVSFLEYGSCQVMPLFTSDSVYQSYVQYFKLCLKFHESVRIRIWIRILNK